MTIGMALVIVAGVFFALVSPAFRKILGLLLVGGVLLGGWAIYQSQQSAKQWKQQRAIAEHFATTAITANDLSLSDVKLERPSYALNASPGSSLDDWLLKGVVTNNSHYGLEQITFEVTFVDCPRAFEQMRLDQIAGSKDCRVVGQTMREATVNDPPGQTREFITYALHFAGMPPEQPTYSRRYNWKVIAIRAGS